MSDDTAFKIAKIASFWFLAFACGSWAYFVALFSPVGYTGYEMMICQPFMAGGLSALLVPVSAVLGLPLVFLRRKFRWLNSPLNNLAVYTIGLVMFFTGMFSVNPNSPDQVNRVFYSLFAGGFLMIFAITNLPLRWSAWRGKPQDDPVDSTP